MKSDSSRNTFDPRKHFSAVRMQQGRVQVDADSNEQIDIVNHHVEVEGTDVIGVCGAPMHYPAFHIVADLTPGPEANISHLSAEERNLPENTPVPEGYTAPSPDFLISAGRYYVDGILCENEHLTSYLKQPDLPNAEPISEPALYLVYVDVWRRLLTAIDDPSMREVALGGPDTATREKTIWQVKHMKLPGAANCASTIDDFAALLRPNKPQMSARTKLAQTPQNPCVVPPGAGYTGLENQFYRIEIHDGGDPFNMKTAGAGTSADRVANHSDQISLTGTWQKGQAIEIFSAGDPMNGTLAHITENPVALGGGKHTLTLDIDISQLAITALQVRAITTNVKSTSKSTFKWSRENGSVLTAILSITGKDVTVHDLGRDDVLGFKPGQWVEISDDELELKGLPGQLAQITFVDTAVNKITLNATPSLVFNAVRHPKLRRWDGIGAVKFHPDDPSDHFLDLESGIQIRFFDGKYVTGDYWTFPARTATADTQSGNIEWPTSGGNALAQAPFGIKHHYCRLAILHWTGVKFDVIQDCRNLFPPLTEFTNMFYEGGDGQEAMPGDALPQPLQVAVFNGRWPVANARVRFKVSSSAGTFAPNADPTILDNGHLATTFPLAPAGAKELITTTGPDGIARCFWLLDDQFDSVNKRFAKPSQQVEARLLDANGDVTPAIVRFDGNLSIAEQVAYKPGDCIPFAQDKTVQKAVDRLAHLNSLYEFSGNNQQVMPGESLKELKVLAANRCGPVSNQKVKFEIISGGGTVNGNAISVEVPTGNDGLASCIWKPGPVNATDKPSPGQVYQEVRATLLPDTSPPGTQPSTVDFTCTLSTAKRVFYDPEKCPALKADKVTNVQDAIDHLCQAHQGGGCDVTVGKDGQFETLDQAIKTLLATGQRDICICLLAGDHQQPPQVTITGTAQQRVKIVGCGRGTRLLFPSAGGTSAFSATGLTSFILRDVEVQGDNFLINITDCETVALEGCHLTQTNQATPLIHVARATTFRFLSNVVEARLPTVPGAKQVFANVPDLVGLFTVSEAEFQSKSSAAASKLANQPEAVRGPMVNLLQNVSNALGVSGAQAKAVQGFVRAMTGRTADPVAIRASLVDVIAAFRTTPGVALVLSDAAANTWIEDNDINGVVGLYGMPGNDILTEAQMNQISAALKTSSLDFTESQSQLHLAHNTLYRLSISAPIIDILRTVNSSVKKSLTGLYRRSFISENEFKGGNNIFLMEHLALESNSFEKDGFADAGSAIVKGGIYVGNFAPDDIKLFNASKANQKAANLGIAILGS
jgi:Family of unknown function (DUF6519)